MKKVKEKKELLQTLLDEGYLLDTDGDWIPPDGDHPFFQCEMLRYCGRQPLNYTWKDSWLEEEEITDEEIWNSIWRTGDYELLVRGHDPYHDMWLLPVRGWQHRSWFKNREHWRI